MKTGCCGGHGHDHGHEHGGEGCCGGGGKGGCGCHYPRRLFGVTGRLATLKPRSHSYLCSRGISLAALL
ncbi:hypothetical protein KCP77_04105 [Salmonella enterica subsp. enterica]|nr:hypothetical protein KCP77_04105 [Salmonella enterica subsp. enterica]